MQKFLWKEIGGDNACRAASGLLCGAHAFPIHTHDFPEVFLVTRGHGTHLINDEQRPLHAGVLVLIRAKDVHGFSSDAEGVLVQNVAIRPNVLAHVKRRYFLHDDTYWNGDTALTPQHHELVAGQMKEFNAAFDQLSAGAGDLFSAERFLLNLLHLVHVGPRSVHAAIRANHPALPDWLAHGLAQWRSEVRHWVEGTPALARLAGRSPEHIARVMRECTGRTPTDWLNECRMIHAAKQLAVTNRKVLDVAMECGFNSLGHFYAVFEQAHGCAPRAYRMRFQPRPI